MTYHQKKNWKSYCSEPLELVENYMAAKADDFEGWCMHHRREIKLDGTRVSIQELKDQGLYYDRPASELIFMRNGEHSTLHNKDKVISVETRKKMSEAQKGKQFSAEHRKKMSESQKGKHLPAEHRHKIAEALKGKHLSAETRQKMSEARKGKKLGVHWWNDGVSCKFAKECPGEGWKRGHLMASRSSQ